MSLQRFVNLGERLHRVFDITTATISGRTYGSRRPSLGRIILI
jgi:hypothetical protein